MNEGSTVIFRKRKENKLHKEWSQTIEQQSEVALGLGKTTPTVRGGEPVLEQTSFPEGGQEKGLSPPMTNDLGRELQKEGKAIQSIQNKIQESEKVSFKRDEEDRKSCLETHAHKAQKRSRNPQMTSYGIGDRLDQVFNKKEEGNRIGEEQDAQAHSRIREEQGSHKDSVMDEKA